MPASTLTNALEPWQRQLKLPDIEALAHEAAAVNEIKRHKHFTVVIGNPPYSNFGQLNKNPFILGLLDDYKRDLGEKKINLDDDFIKFVRFSQRLLDHSAVGVFGMITNNVFIDGITHRRMRESLAESFQKLWVLDLHGSSIKIEQTPDGTKDENVFDIQQGVGIGIFCRSALQRTATTVWHSNLWGLRGHKYATLERLKLGDGSWQQVNAKSPYHFFVPKDFGDEDEYKSGWSTTDIFRIAGQGIETKRDALTIRFTVGKVQESLDDVRHGRKNTVAAKYGLPDDGRDWTYDWAKEDILKNKGVIAPISYRPFDLRFTYFTGKTKGFIAYPRTSVSRHLLDGSNLGLIVNRFVKLDYYAHVFVIRGLIDRHLLETANACLVVYPLSLLASEASDDLDFGGEAKSLNFSEPFLRATASALELPQGGYGLPRGLTAEDVFHYAYAVFHSPGYRSRYAEFLKIDFPRLPLTENLDLFRALARLGGELVALHLLESPKLDQPITEFIGGRNPEVEKVSWSKNTVWVDKAQTTGFKGVPEDVWNFHIGGYQVCEKWLKDRKGRTLSKDDIAHYQKIVVALNETIRLMNEIDEVIEKHGGWPGAFRTSASSTSSDASRTTKEYGESDEDLPLAAEEALLFESKQTATQITGEDGDSSPLPRTQVTEIADDGDARAIDDIEQSEIMATIRQVFSDGAAREREVAIRDVARELGFDRTGSRIQERLHGDFIAAVKRGVVANENGGLRLATRTIEDYDRDELKALFLSDMGNTWWDRDDAINRAARYLGFTRTGSRIYDYFKSIINGLIRDGKLESDPDKGIRRT